MVGRKIGDAIHLHAPRDAPQERGALVIGEVAARAGSQVREHLAQHRLIVRLSGRRPRGSLEGRQAQLRPDPPALEDAAGHLGHRQNPVHHAGFDGREGHALEVRLLRVLSQGETAPLFDSLETNGAVGVAAGQDDRGGLRAMSLRQGAKEQINRHPPGAVVPHRTERKVVFGHRQVLSRRNDVNVVRLHLGQRAHLHHRHGRGPLQNLRHGAVVLGRQMHDDDKDEAAVDWQSLEELLQRLQAAGRSAQTHHRQGSGGFGFRARAGVGGIHQRGFRR